MIIHYLVEYILCMNNRISELRKKLKSLNLDAFIISNYYNILYLTGFKTLTTDEREAFVLVTNKNIYLFTDARYLEKNSSRVMSYELKLLEPEKGLIFHLQEIIREEGIKELGFEAEDIKYNEFNSLKQKLVKTDLVPTAKLVIDIRKIKDEKEIEKIKKACEIGERCLQQISGLINEGVSEKEVAFKIEFWLKEKHFDIAFDPIVAVDANSAIPHYNTKTGEGRVKKGSIVLLDFGAKYKDYLSDISRIFFYGKPNSEIINIYNILLDAQEKTLQSVGNFSNLRDIDLFCRKLINDKKLPNYSHSTGHGVGLEVHEYPKVSLNSQDNKKENQVFTIEPGVYLEGKFGMRIEDTVVIKKGVAESLTKFTKKAFFIKS